MKSNILKRLAGKVIPRHRKYPIKYDEHGISIRKRAFELFDKGRKPEEVEQELDDISLPTAVRYYSQWKNVPKNLDANYRLLKSILKSDPEAMQELVSHLAQQTGRTEDAIVAELQKP